MARPRKRHVILAATVVLAVFGFLVVLTLYFFASGAPSKIADFHPSSFGAVASSEFFYSIGDDLRYSDRIDPQAPSLIRGHIKNFLVSPDAEKIAVVADGRLVVIRRDSAPQSVTAVDSIYRDPKAIGKQFFRDDDFQWSKDSRVLYLIRDEYYNSQGSQLYSDKGEIWKYNVESGALELVLRPFKAFSYFFGVRSGIYFSVPTETGDLRLRYFDGSSVKDVGDVNAWEIPHNKLSPNFPESPFYSFSIHDYERAVLPSKGVHLVPRGIEGPQDLIIGDKSYLAITRGEGFKGPYYCSEKLRSVFLPGDRYFMFNVPYCGNYNGQLLIDTLTGQYQRLPSDSVVYLTVNTDTYPRYRVTGGGIVIGSDHPPSAQLDDRGTRP